MNIVTVIKNMMLKTIMIISLFTQMMIPLMLRKMTKTHAINSAINKLVELDIQLETQELLLEMDQKP